MRTLTTILAATLLAASACAQNVIKLPEPDKNVSMTLYQALQQRASVREYSDTPISDATLSQLLWAAQGVNRPDGRRTTPTTVNAQEEYVYVCRADGAYFYNAHENTLEKVSDKDLRAAVAGPQTGVANAPIFLVIVCDLNKFGGRDDRTHIFAAIDAGYVSQNICLACEALGLVTVPRGTMDRNALWDGLGLKEGQDLMVNHPIGYKK